MATKKQKYDVKKTILKGIELFVYGGISYLVGYLSGLPQTETVVFGTALLKMLMNYLKHKN